MRRQRCVLYARWWWWELIDRELGKYNQHRMILVKVIVTGGERCVSLDVLFFTAP